MKDHRVRVFFDSSFLMAVAESPTSWADDLTDSTGSYVPVLLDSVERELMTMGKGKGSKGTLARVALLMAAGFERKRSGKATPDDELMSEAMTSDGAVATLDRNLIASLRSSGVKVVTLSSGRVKADW